MKRYFPTDAETVILRALREADEPLYGLQIVEATGGEVARGSIYVLLGRLQEMDLVAMNRPRRRKHQAHAGKPRPTYAVSDRGRRLLAFMDNKLGDL